MALLHGGSTVIPQFEVREFYGNSGRLESAFFPYISGEQDAEFKKIMELPKTRENTFRFMALMNDEQFRTVGY